VGSGDELVASPVLSLPKKPEKPAEPDEDGSDADDEEEDSDSSKRSSKRKLVRPLKKVKPKKLAAQSEGGTAKKPVAPAIPQQRRSLRTSRTKAKDVSISTNPKTATVLTSHADDPFVMVQYGGGTGSNAGDAAVLTLRKSRRLFSLDFGGTKGQQASADTRRSAARTAAPEDTDESDFESEVEHQGKGRDVGDNTHPHSDHIGEQTLKTVEVFDRFWVGASYPKFLTKVISKNQKKAQKAEEDGEEPEQNQVEQISENGEVLFSWVSKQGKIKRLDNPKLRVSTRAILPDISKLPESDTDQNKRSTGALVSVDMVGKKTERVFTMLTLGDMTPKEGQAAVEEVWRDKDGSQVVDVIKMAHHGSDQNIAATPESVVTAGVTQLIISGYTMKSTATLIQFIRNTKPKKVLILFNDSEHAKAFNKLGTAANLYAAAKDLGVEVEVAKDYVMAVNDDGAVSLEPSGW
jgi:hypothetical protein